MSRRHAALSRSEMSDFLYPEAYPQVSQVDEPRAATGDWGSKPPGRTMGMYRG